MRYWKYVFVAAILGSTITLPNAGWATPLASTLAMSSKAATADSLVEVHGWHCARSKGLSKGKRVWHRHRRACQETLVYDDEYFDDDFRLAPGRPPNLYINPQIRLHFGKQGDD